jgi:MinD-like ATPase involved in chromosome partitioning or flagellar assembly
MTDLGARDVLPVEAARRHGWRGLLRRLVLEENPPSGSPDQPPGPVSGPSVSEGSIDPLNLPDLVPAEVDAVRKRFDKPRVVAFVNPKGGVHKTTATVLAAATFGALRGSGVLAWDDNELRGTLGLRAGASGHGRTVRHLLDDLWTVESMADRGPSRLDPYLRKQQGGFDVLAAAEDAQIGRRLSASTVGRMASLFSSTHDLLLVDTGNNVDSENWRTIAGVADQLVVVTLPREDAAFTADWMLDLLIEDGHAEKVSQAVTLMSSTGPVLDLGLAAELGEHFAGRTRVVAHAPYDPALESGGRIDYSALLPVTREAWVRVAATISAGL